MPTNTRLFNDWNYDIFEDLIENPRLPLPGLDEVHLQMSLVFSQLQKTHLPQLAKATRSLLPPCASPPTRDRSENFVVHQARSLQIKLNYFTAACDSIEKNDSYYWKKEDIRDIVEREVPRLRAFVRIVQRIIESAQPTGKMRDNISPPGFFLPEEESESRCSTPNADQLVWEDAQEMDSPSGLAEYIGSECPTPHESQILSNDEKQNEVTRCTAQTEWFLSSEDQEPELPVDTDESTEENYYDEEVDDISSSVRGNNSSLPSVASVTPSSSFCSPSSHLSTWELDVGWPQFSTSSLPEKEKKEPWREYVEWQTDKKISMEAFDKYAEMAENCVGFDYQSTVVDPAVLLNELNRRKTYRVIESEQSRKSVAVMDLGESIMCMNLLFESALPDFSRDDYRGRE